MVLAFILTAFIGIANYLEENLSIKGTKYKPHVISFVAGFSVSYIFLSLLPELYEGVIGIGNRTLFVFVLIGFVLFHMIEKFIYQHVGKGKISERLKLTHSIGIFFYEIIAGIVLVNFLKIGILEGLLFFIPVFSHTAMSNLSIHKIHGLHHHKEQLIENKFMRVLLAGGSLYGAVLASLYLISSKLSFTLTGLVAGILLYVVIRETIPKDKEGNPLMFVVGVLLYSMLIFGIWLFA
ncbi:hypothetical protein HYV89_01555 [Candidatus Woesearchaeota archaeon]|nr:hypothetical protein [Candidatus Woesearchaeota archaeon]